MKQDFKVQFKLATLLRIHANLARFTAITGDWPGTNLAALRHLCNGYD